MRDPADTIRSSYSDQNGGEGCGALAGRSFLHRDQPHPRWKRAPTASGSTAHLGSLVGRLIPPVMLEGHDRPTLDLEVLLEESPLSVLYFYPADNHSPLRDDMAFHSGFRDRLDDFSAKRCRPVGISTEPAVDQADRIRFQKLRHRLHSDPQLFLARELALPTYRDGGEIFYHRLVLVVFKGVVAQSFLQIRDAARGATQVLDWLQAQPT